MFFANPCDRSVRCFPCADESSNPLANLSTEDPDTNLYLSVVFRRVPSPPHNNWNQDSCVGMCESAISQEDADDCAARAALECIINTHPPPNPRNPSWTQLLCNQVQNCQNGSDCYSQPACSVESFSVADANAIAASLCDFRVHNAAIASPCAVPPVIPEPPVPSCPVESGPTAPISLELTTGDVNWETFEVIPASIAPFVSSGACNPTSRFFYKWTNMHDHPPGEYHVEYVSGFFVNSPNTCGGSLKDTLVHIYQLWDDEHSYDAPTVCGQAAVLANQFRRVEPQPDSGNFGSGLFLCEATYAAAEAAYDAFYNSPGAKKRFVWNYGGVAGKEHTNTGGDFRYVLTDGVLTTSTPVVDLLIEPGFEFKLKIVQIAGLIHQPRKLAIVDYALLVSQFSDPVAAAAWDGELNTRATYTAAELKWTDPAAGAFGGAELTWVNSHPTSANGFGWRLDLFSSGSVLMYRAYKAVGPTSEGYYYRHSSTPSGPDCCQVLDNSDSPWEPPE